MARRRITRQRRNTTTKQQTNTGMSERWKETGCDVCDYKTKSRGCDCNTFLRPSHRRIFNCGITGITIINFGGSTSLASTTSMNRDLTNGAILVNGSSEAKMSFLVLHPTMEFHLLIIAMSASASVGDWIPVHSTPLHKVPEGNMTWGSTKLFTVGNTFDEEFTCANVHNLTMLGYSEGEAQQPAQEEDFLDGLHTKLTRQIEDRMTNLGRSRRGKTYHIGFPSLEGALVSISLLLFAVYLIKLVMKLMYTFSAKRGTTEYVGFLSNLRQPIVISPNRQRRDIDLELEGYRIRQVIQEQYKNFN